jgi:glycosyltransferase involved in cell wall biosynthesis
MPPITPFFSVIITTHLRPALLQRALLSLRQQTFQDFEIIVVADTLDAATAEACARWLRETDSFLKRTGPAGPAASRNLGLALARGKWVAFLDDDDTFTAEHLAGAHRVITQPATEALRQAEVLFSDYAVVTENRAQDPIPVLAHTRVSLRDQPVANLYVKNFIPNNALLYQRQVLTGCLTDPHLESQEDWDFLLSVCAKAMPVHYEGGGSVVHKDQHNPGSERGSRPEAQDANVVVDVLHVFRRWRAPTAELRAQRQAVLMSVGLNLPPSLL